MGKRYANSLTAQTNTGNSTLQQTIGSTNTRFQVYDLIISAAGVAPADNAAEYQLRRLTAAGTCSAFTPIALDNADPATLLTLTTAGCGFRNTGEPTYTANTNMLDIGVNMRATFRWVARERSEIVAPASTNGLGLFVVAVNSAFSTNVTQLHEE
jgi:hypothetical protein